PELSTRLGLCDKLRSQTREFCIRDRSSLFQAVELAYFVSGAKANNTSKLIARLLSLLDISLGHPATLRDQVHKHAKERKYDQPYDPCCFRPTGDVMTPEQVQIYCN